MKNQSVRFVIAAALAAMPGLLLAQSSAHYTPGIEGIRGASLPPPGFYAKDYNVAYYATRVNNASGNNASPPNFETFAYVNVPRAIWITDTKFLGGYVGVDALLPLIYQHVRAGGYDNGTFGIGDLYGEGTLSWHVKQFDFAVASGIWAPTGDFAQGSTRAGMGYWTFMQTAGATWYIDEEKTWAVSALNRFEFNTEQRDTHVTPGDAYTLEWGVSKSVCKEADLGVVGYYQQQVTANSSAPASSRNRVAAIGPEVSVMFPKQMVFVLLRYNYEFMAENRAQGHTVALTVTKRF